MSTILVADDEFDMLGSIRSILEEEGYEVRTASDGAEALETLEKADVDLLITDVMMPRLSGYDLLERMRELKRHRKTPSIVMSCVRPAAHEKRLGGSQFLCKPFSIDELLAAVRKALR